MGMNYAQYWENVNTMQDWLLNYCIDHRISSDMMQQMLATLLCTCTIRNGRNVEQLTDAVESEFETCTQAWEKTKHLFRKDKKI